MLKSESLVKLAPALVAAQKKMGAALKDAKNPFFKSKYADLNAVIDASVPTLNEEGIAVLQAVNGMDVETILLHESGEYVASCTPIVVAKQNDPQALGSAISYAKRYGLQAMAVLKAEDDDGEGAMGRDTKTSTKQEVKMTKQEFDKSQQVTSGKVEAKVEEKAAPKTEVKEAVVTKAKSGWASKRAKPVETEDEGY